MQAVREIESTWGDVSASPWVVLAVDDEPEVLQVTRLVLANLEFEGRGLELLSATSAAEAAEVLRQRDDIAVLLLDVVMESPHAGLDLVRRVREELGNHMVRIVLRTGQPGEAPEHEVVAAYDINDYREKTELTSTRLAATLYAALRSYRDICTVTALGKELVDSQLEMVYLLAGTVETRSRETANHVRRVGLLAEMLGRGLGLAKRDCELLRLAAPLHDIGKVGIPDSILNKPGPHTDDESRIMRTHTEIGSRLLGNSRRPVMQLAAEIALTHHENFDGSGYPNELAGTQIPVSGRITMVADVFDALGSRRCYKEPWGTADIRSYLVQQRGRKFDPDILDQLFTHWAEALKMRHQLPD